MKSSGGEHFIALDHVRAIAAFMVFTWHFTHSANGYPVPFEYVPSFFPFSILAEGHTGVALFMTLSGYLFAKLLDGRSIVYRFFILNRLLRLLPLLICVIVVVGIVRVASGAALSDYVYSILKGVMLPTLPNGGWSITVEFHYYLILPLLLFALKRSVCWGICIVLGAVTLRAFIYCTSGEVQSLAYWTIIGRVDQFVLGMVAYQLRHLFVRHHVVVVMVALAFMAFYWFFDLQGGFYQSPSYPSSSPIWVFLPAVEGAAYAICIAWYEGSFSHSRSGFSRFVGRLGQYSYSIYLLHFFVVFHAARFVNERLMDISGFYLSCVWSLGFFLMMFLPAYVCFRFVESPFLKMRRPYVRG